ncbi:hypothetical protein [Dichotomicrobium thermohalophilum]|uniref:Uncharacterized protein n=1 Tax=Dichotomicrobium thermohalophilum TaxID=933063 RepID=A0A397Q3D6_9HYPH|nr:hypothetical protein [Dichotomicrobium thermohalophilum]RIA55642.1 hypothetical protein BXY53_0712 [Dichotomicrobium thermohalophilum]
MTKSENPVPADQILAKIFEVVLEEARQRPEFAEKLVNALPRGAIAEIQKPARARKAKAGFDPNAFSLVAVMQTEGMAGVKRRLNPIKRKQDLRALAEAQHMPVDRETFYSDKTKLQALKDELIRATEARIADRMAAAS